MSGFLYFLPDCADAPELDDLRKLGLGYAFEKTPAATIKGNGSGPGGLSGLLIGAEEALVYDPPWQTWRRMPGGEGTKGQRDEGTDGPPHSVPLSLCPSVPIFVGMWNHRPPTPDELVRRDVLEGHSVRLGDGREWIAPIARRWISDTADGGWFNALPHRWGLNDGGEWIRTTVLPSYAELWGIAEWFWEAFAEGLTTGVITVHLPESKVIGGAIAALAANYRIGSVEANMLHLFEDGTAAEILRALIDADRVLDWLKKKHSESQTGAPAP